MQALVNVRGQSLAEFNPPLVKRIDPPQQALCIRAVFKQGKQRPQDVRRQPGIEDRGAGFVALEMAPPVRVRLAQHQRPALGEAVRI